ncbi:UDP-N-acetylglucosamine--N-acetylmuramyl-(pentapeptide) pyrophosphoryl-undecaprenol N-acetylglucosamine transferase [subsurface metagenome]
MKKVKKHIRVIISGGGTGGHIFPAIAIADEIKRRDRNAEILFVGSRGRMEMERIPAAGYKIKGLPVSGIQRRFTLKNIVVLVDLIRSLRIAGKIIRDFRPDIAIGVGGYASGPVLRIAAKHGIPTILQEQNSCAGITNRLLSRKASIICVAYRDMDKYFPKEKIVLTGNPVRMITISDELIREGIKYFGLINDWPIILVVGGSLGARTINEDMLEKISFLEKQEIQILWQTGKYYYDEIKEKLVHKKPKNIHICDFISRMDLAYNVADLMISRAGAISLSEICLTGRAAILVPSPNVAEDHQTKNAKALVSEKAAIMISDADAKNKLIDKMMELMDNPDMRAELARNSKKLAIPNSAALIVDEVDNLIVREGKN